jgi:hypothetical protein
MQLPIVGGRCRAAALPPTMMSAFDSKMRGTVLFWHPFPGITRELFEELYKDQTEAGWDTNTYFYYKKIRYEMNFQETDTYDMYKDIPALRNKNMAHISSKLKFHCAHKHWNQQSPYDFLTFTNNEDEVQIGALTSNDILMIAAHGNSTWNSISNKLMMINMVDLATGLFRCGLNKEDAPHIILLSCQAGSAHRDEFKEYNRYPYILLLHNELRSRGCDARITGAVCTFSSFNVQPCVETAERNLLIHQKDTSTSTNFKQKLKGFWKFLTIEGDHVTITNNLDHALRCSTPAINQISKYRGISMSAAEFANNLCPPPPEQVDTSEPVPIGLNLFSNKNITTRRS